MSIKNRNGKTISKNELALLAKMMKESLQAHSDDAISAIPEFQGDQQEVLKQISTGYKDAVPTVESTFEKYANSDEDISVEEIFQGVFKQIYEKSLEKCKKYNPDDIQVVFQKFVQPTGDDSQLNLFDESYPSPQNKEDAVFETAKGFTLADKPMEGVEDIEEFKPNDRIADDVNYQRMGNSSTYLNLLEEINDRNQKQLSEGGKAMFLFYTAAQTTRVFASDFMQKEEVSFSDLYNAFTSINEILRDGNSAGGKMRGEQVTSGEINGIGSAKCPAAMYNIMDTIAEHMNVIKRTEDPALRKTQAIQLAAFTYQMTLSAHIFGDANGRSCRLLSDVILQSFGLPPHLPSDEEKTILHTVDGTPLDFKHGADVFLENVKESDKVMSEAKEANVQDVDEEWEREKQQRAAEEKLQKQRKLVERVDDNLTKQFRDFSLEVKNAKSSFHNSKEYKQFGIMADSCASLLSEINRAKTAQENQVNLKNLDPAANKIAQMILGNKKPKDIAPMDKAGRLMEYFSFYLEKAARNYESYKMKDHTLDPKAEPDKKRLNKDDIKKLNLINKVLGKPSIPANPYKENSKVQPQEEKTQLQSFNL